MPVVPAGLGSLPGQGRTRSPHAAAGPGLAGISPEMPGLLPATRRAGRRALRRRQHGNGALPPRAGAPQELPVPRHPHPQAAGPGWAGLPQHSRVHGVRGSVPSTQAQSGSVAQPRASRSEVPRVPARTQAPTAGWGTRTAPRTRHEVGSAAPRDTALAPTRIAGPQPAPAMLGTRPGTAGPRAGTSPLPHKAAVHGGTLQSPPAQREEKLGQRGLTLGSRSLLQNQWVPRRSRFQSGRAAGGTGLTGKEPARSNTPWPRNHSSPAWHSAAPSPAARCPRVPGTGTVRRAWMLLGTPQGPVPSHGARAGEPRGKRQVTTILRGSTG